MKTKELSCFFQVGISEKGPSRLDNQDYSGYFETINGSVFVVCDGIGGLPCGQLAAQTVVNSLKFFFSNFYYKDAYAALNDSLDYAQKRITEEQNNNFSARGMGTTVVIALIRYNKIYYAHLGDSRIYFFHNGQLTQLTADDTYVYSLVENGKITQQQAKSHPLKNQLTAAIGATFSTKAHICENCISPVDNDLLLLSTDGLHDMITNKQIQAILAHRGYIEDKAKELVKTALNNGGNDNITIKLIKFYNISKTNKNISIKNFNKQNFSYNNILKFIFIVFILFFLSFVIINYKSNKVSQAKNEELQTKEQFLTISVDSLSNIPGIIFKYNVDEKNVIYYTKDKQNFVRIPIKTYHYVRYYDNLYLLSLLYSVPVNLIMRANDIRSSYYLSCGQTLVIPYN